MWAPVDSNLPEEARSDLPGTFTITSEGFATFQSSSGLQIQFARQAGPQLLQGCQ